MKAFLRFATGFAIVLAVNYFIWDIPARAGVRTPGRPQ